MICDAETLELLCESVRRFVRELLVPAERLVDEIPAELIDGMSAPSLFGMTLAEEYGGLARNAEERMHVGFELTHASPAFRSLLVTTVVERGVVVLNHSRVDLRPAD